jgi:DNA-binding NarL/FixJ family response regulator
MPIRILTYEDNQQLRESITAMISLSKDFTLAGEFGDALQVTQHIKTLRPEVILMDIDLPGTNGIDAVKEIRKLNERVHIIMLTVFDDNTHVMDAIRAGASGYLLKKDISTKLFSAIEEILNGGAPMSPTVARMVIASIQPNPKRDLYQLTIREKEILASLAKGNSYKLVATHFDISIDTVRTHIKNIYEKLHVHSQTEAVSKAIHEKLV